MNIQNYSGDGVRSVAALVMCVTAALVLVLFARTQSEVYPHSRIGSRFEPIQIDHENFELTVRATIWQMPKWVGLCPRGTVSLLKPEHVVSLSPDKWSISLADTLPESIEFTLRARPNDTVPIGLRYDCPEPVGTGNFYIATSSDSVRFLTVDEKARLFDSLRTARYQARRDSGLIKDLVRTSPPPRDSAERAALKGGTYITKPDTSFSNPHKIYTTTREKMRELEKEPLKGTGSQLIEVDGKRYRRTEGEMFFRERSRLTNEELIEGRRRAREEGVPFDGLGHFEYIADLRNPDHYALAAELAHRMAPADSAGFYHVFILRSVKHKLLDAGVPLVKVSTVRNRHRDSDRPKTQPGETESVEGRGRSTLFIEGFDNSSYLDRWYSNDYELYQGRCTWDIEPCDPAGGYSCIWCAGSCRDGCSVCENWVEAMLQLRSSSVVDISDYVDVCLDFEIKHEIDPDHEYTGFELYIREYDGDWELWEYWEGDETNWQWESLYIPDHYETLQIEFWFCTQSEGYSDFGALIDELEVYGFEAYPNLTYNWPSMWDFPIVPDSGPGTHSVGYLMGGAPTYIDWAIENNGGVASSDFHVALALDNQWNIIHEWSVSGLSAPQIYLHADEDIVISEGSHELFLIVDNRNEVAEESEEDNIWSWTFYWNPPAIVPNGGISYQYPDPTGTQYDAARGVTICAYDSNASGSVQLGCCSADIATGDFSFGPLTLPDSDCDLFFKMKAENEAAWAVNGHLGNPIECQSSLYPNQVPGACSFGINIPVDDGGPFFLIDVCLDAFQYWSSVPGMSPPDPVEVVHGSNTGTWCKKQGDNIWIEIEKEAYASYPDTYDRFCILHEYGHKMEYERGFLTGSGEHHKWLEKTAPEDAASEGYAHLHAGLVQDSAQLANHWADYSFGVFFDLENGSYAEKTPSAGTICYSSANAMRLDCEASVAGILWDMVDGVDDDFSSTEDWDTLQSCDGNPNGYLDGDTIQIPVATLMEALTQRTVAGERIQDMERLWCAWFSPPWLSTRHGMIAVYEEHGQIRSCGVGRSGNIDGDWNDTVNISDLVLLVAFMFNGFETPYCIRDEGDINGSSGGPYVSDLVYLVTWMFSGGPPLAWCPYWEDRCVNFRHLEPVLVP